MPPYGWLMLTIAMHIDDQNTKIPLLIFAYFSLLDLCHLQTLFLFKFFAVHFLVRAQRTYWALQPWRHRIILKCFCYGNAKCNFESSTFPSLASSWTKKKNGAILSARMSYYSFFSMVALWPMGVIWFVLRIFIAIWCLSVLSLFYGISIIIQSFRSKYMEYAFARQQSIQRFRAIFHENCNWSKCTFGLPRWILRNAKTLSAASISGRFFFFSLKQRGDSRECKSCSIFIIWLCQIVRSLLVYCIHFSLNFYSHFGPFEITFTLSLPVIFSSL